MDAAGIGRVVGPKGEAGAREFQNFAKRTSWSDVTVHVSMGGFHVTARGEALDGCHPIMS